jgi:hypothetical protein
LQQGKSRSLTGDPDQGKSILSLDLIARRTSTRPMPDGPAWPKPVSVVLIADEDSVRDTVHHRLRAAGRRPTI